MQVIFLSLQDMYVDPVQFRMKIRSRKMTRILLFDFDDQASLHLLLFKRVSPKFTREQRRERERQTTLLKDFHGKNQQSTTKKHRRGERGEEEQRRLKKNNKHMYLFISKVCLAQALK